VLAETGDILVPAVDPVLAVEGHILVPAVDPVLATEGDILEQAIPPVLATEGDVLEPGIDAVLAVEGDILEAAIDAVLAVEGHILVPGIDAVLAEGWEVLEEAIADVQEPAGIVLSAPVAVGFTAIACGPYHSLALTADGSIAAWGSDGEYTLSGTGTDPVLDDDGRVIEPGTSDSVESYGAVTTTPTSAGFIAISAGLNFSLALTADGTIVAWGADNQNQVTDVPTGTGYTHIACGDAHGLAIAADGSVVVWGKSTDNLIAGVPAGLDFKRIAAGGNQCLTVRADGSLITWGSNSSGLDTAKPTTTEFLLETASVQSVRYALGALFEVGSMFKVCFRHVNDDETSYKYVVLALDTESNNLYTQVYESWNNVTGAGSNVAYRSNTSLYAQRLRSVTSSSDSVYLFVHPRWFVIATPSMSGTDSSFCGVTEIEGGLEDEVPGEFPLFAWIHGSMLYGSAMPDKVPNQTTPTEPFCFSLPRSLKGGTGASGSRHMLTGTIANRSLNLDSRDGTHCSRHHHSGGSYYNRYYWYTYSSDRNASQTWKYCLEAMLPNGTNPNKNGANFVFTPYASCTEQTFAHVRGRFFGIKLLGNNVGGLADTIDIPVDAEDFYSPNAILKNHFVLTNNRGGRMALPL